MLKEKDKIIITEKGLKFGKTALLVALVTDLEGHSVWPPSPTLSLSLSSSVSSEALLC